MSPGASTIDISRNGPGEGDNTVPSEEVDDQLTLLDELFVSDRVAQLTIFGLTLNLLYLKFEEEPWLLSYSIMPISILLAYLGNFWMNYSSFGSKTLPSFNTFYLFFLEVTLSLLFDRENFLMNTNLAFSIADLQLTLKLPLQLIFILLEQPPTDVVRNSLKALVINYIFLHIFYRVSKLRSLDKVECHMFAVLCTNLLVLQRSASVWFIVLRGCLQSFLLVAAIASTVSFVFDKISVPKVIRTVVLLPAILLGFPFFIQHTFQIAGDDPLTWLVQNISSSTVRQNITLIWLGSSLLLIPSVFALKSNCSLNTSRKIWHFALLPLLIPATVADKEFVKIAISGTVVLFLMVEYIRFLHLYPVGQYLDRHLRSFADFRDEQGPIIISYIYLIIGVALPLLINDSIVGIVSLGVGDSLASIIGKKMGKHRWPNTLKTIEGTIAFVLATTITSLLLKEFWGFFPDHSYLTMAVVCFIAGILEANSTLNDNLLIPTYMMILMETLKGY